MREWDFATTNGGYGAYWHHPLFLILLVIVTTVPLIYPAIPPLTDLPGHLASYHIAAALESSTDLQRYYDIRWEVAGNLGVNLLIIPLTKLFDVELGLKVIVLFIPMILAAGLLGVARELHGGIQPTALFALPLTYHHAFHFGFLNFSLSAGLCFVALWLWLWMGRIGRQRLRTLLFIPVATAVWLTHAYGWGMLGILLFSFQVVDRRRTGVPLPFAAIRAAIDCLPLAIPILIMLVWPSRNVANTGGWFEWTNKILWIVSILRERWQIWDAASAALLLALMLLGLIGRTIPMEPRARVAVILLFIAFMILPRVLLGSGYADMRLAAFIVATALIGLAPPASWTARKRNVIAALALVFLLARISVTTAAYAQISDRWGEQLAAVDHIARGSRVLVLDDVRCSEWADDRLDHVSSFAVVRKDAFTNGQFTVAGALVDVKYRAGTPFVADPSHLMRRPPCEGGKKRIRAALGVLPRHFDYIWFVGLPRAQWPRTPGLRPIWNSNDGLLLRSSLTGTPTAG